MAVSILCLVVSIRFHKSGFVFHSTHFIQHRQCFKDVADFLNVYENLPRPSHAKL